MSISSKWKGEGKRKSPGDEVEETKSMRIDYFSCKKHSCQNHRPTCQSEKITVGATAVDSGKRVNFFSVNDR